MTDQELIEQVATKVMGWKDPECRQVMFGGEMVTYLMLDEEYHEWNPLTNDAHMDMVLDRMDAIGASDIICMTTRHVSECSVLANDDEFYGVCAGHSMAALKRAMLIAMLMVILEACDD